MNKKPIFDAVRTLRNGQAFTLPEVHLLDAAIDAALGVAPPPPAPVSGKRRVSAKGVALMHSFEGCRLEAYPDPGSRDGNPWTIGWGSTGPDIKRGVRWTQAEADARYQRDLDDFAGKVEALLEGFPTTQHQFDAMVCLAYNIGIGRKKTATLSAKGFISSSVLRLHKAGKYKDAARAFLLWNKNDGVVMRGLTRRRLAEADLYDDL